MVNSFIQFRSVTDIHDFNFKSLLIRILVHPLYSFSRKIN